MHFTLLCVCVLAIGVLGDDVLEREERAANCPRITGFPGRVKYRRRGTSARFRCPRKTKRYGPRSIACLPDNTWSAEPPKCIRPGCVPIDIQNAENLDMTEMYGGALLKFACDNDFQLLGPTEVYCDGKIWSSTLPKCIATTDLLECDFEDDLCGWSQDDSDDADWSRGQGQTPTGGTGPKHDHTFPNDVTGHYMYFESSSPSKKGHECRLLSPIYMEDLSEMCFGFWYHILGPDEINHVGSLDVFVRPQSDFLDDIQPVFTKAGNQGDTWQHGEIYIDKMDEPYQIIIVATKRMSYISDIAIDDLSLYNCSKTTTTMSTTPVTSTTPTTSATTPTRKMSTTAGSIVSTTTSNVPVTITHHSKPTDIVAFVTASDISTTTLVSVSTSTQNTTKIPSTGKSSSHTKTQASSTTSNRTATPVQSTATPTTFIIDTTPTHNDTPRSTRRSTAAATVTISQSTATHPTTTDTTTTVVTDVPKQTTKFSKQTQMTPSSHNPGVSTTLKTKSPVSKYQPSSSMSFTTKQQTESTYTINRSTTKKATTDRPTTLIPTTNTTMTIQSTTEARTTTTPVAATTRQPSTTTTVATTTRQPSTTTTVAATTLKTSTTTVAATTRKTSKTTHTDKLPTERSTTTTKPTSKSTKLSTLPNTKLTTTKRTTTFYTSRQPLQTTRTTTRKPTSIHTPNKQTKVVKYGTTKPKTVAPNTPTKTTPLSNKIANPPTNYTIMPTVTTTTFPLNSTNPSINIVNVQLSKHPEDETLKPLLIGLGVGVIVGLIIIGVVAYVCVRRRKFYTSRYEDELKPITKATSADNLNTAQYEYLDNEDEFHI